MVCERTAWAERVAGGADHRAEIHQRLIPQARPPRRQECRGDLPDRSVAGGADQRRRMGSQTGEDAARVGLDDRLGAIEGDRCDRPGGVSADAGKLPQRRAGVGETPPVVGDDPLRGGVELPGPAVVPQPFPGAEHVGFRRCRELRDGRKPLHEAEEKIDDPIDLRLLEHHLADPGAVGIGPSTPGEITPHPLEPAEEGCLDRFASGPQGRRERPVDQVAGTTVGRLSAPPGGGPADPFAPRRPRLLRHDPLPSGGGSFPTKVGVRPGIRSAVAPWHDPTAV